jgi:hypothetical protein
MAACAIGLIVDRDQVQITKTSAAKSPAASVKLIKLIASPRAACETVGRSCQQRARASQGGGPTSSCAPIAYTDTVALGADTGERG